MKTPNGFQTGSPAEQDRTASVLLDEIPPQTSVPITPVVTATPEWVANAGILWERRRLLMRVAAISLLLSLLVAFLLPKQYKSSAQIMPPSNPSMGTAMLAALAGRALGGMNGLSNLAGSLLGGNNSTSLFVNLLSSDTIEDRLIDRFHLQSVYHKRYRVDTSKLLARETTINDDKKNGVITITVADTDPRRARH